MIEVTAAHRAAFRQARQAALDAIATLNGLFADTGRPYRAALRLERDPVTADDGDPFKPEWLDDDDPADDDERHTGMGREGAERENEGSDL